MNVDVSSALRPTPTAQHNALREAAFALEAGFLAEMLKAAGLSFGGGAFAGAGESQFSSFLTAEHAKMLAETGGIGLAEAIFESLKEQANEK